MTKKFRAWDGTQWHYENIFLSHDGVLWVRNPDRTLRRVNWPVVFFTGLLCKNGREIYEGDILNFTGPLEGKGDVYWDTGLFRVKGDDLDVVLGHAVEKEVIGNIYENPELIKNKSVEST